MSHKDYRHFKIETDADGITWVYFDYADGNTNVLSRESLQELEAMVNEFHNNTPKAVIFASAKENGFIAGADIKEFANLTQEEETLKLVQQGQGIMDKINSLKCSTVALINGFCLGGGMELALACRHRVAIDTDNCKLGLPEILLGLHPGFGGTVRLPPLVGAPSAMDMMLTGRSLRASAAWKIGLVDYSVPPRHAKEAAKKCALSKSKSHKKGWKQLSNHRFVRPLLAKMIRKKVARRANPKHYPAPYALIDLWLKHADSAKKMMQAEAESFVKLMLSSTSKNLRHVYFLREEMKTVGKQTKFEGKHVHVVGAGVMGGDIAAWCALRGYQVTLQDRKEETLGRALGRAYQLFKKRLKKPRPIEAAMDRLMPDLDGLGIARADIIIEAIVENKDAKQALFKELEGKMKKDAILCTNTSSIPLEELCTVLNHPQRLVGLHFFNPVAKMELVEIVHGQQTSEAVAQQAAAFTHNIGRLPLPVKSSPGFLVNRILMPYLLEAVIMESEGIPKEDIDKAAVNFGMPMGPIILADTVGLDICLAASEVLTASLGGEIPQKLRDLVAAGNLGKKSGKGFYDHKSKSKPQSTGSSRLEELEDRLIYKILNECTACLREEVVASPELLDAGIIFGTGFAPFRGGPMHYLQDLGTNNSRQRMNELHDKYGDRFSVDPGWSSL